MRLSSFPTPAAALLSLLLLAAPNGPTLAQSSGAVPPATVPATLPKTLAGDFKPQRFAKEGVSVEFAVGPLGGADGKPSGLVAGSDALVTFRLTDARTGTPLAGLRPNAWIARRTSERAPNEAECKEKIRAFMGGLLSVRADVDLNSYLLLTLNHDSTITFINPQIAFSRTKLESIVPLPAAGADWALSPDKEFLYVTMPDASAVAVVNTVTRKLVTTIPVGEKAKPVRIALDPAGRRAWVGLDNSPAVAVLDTAAHKLAGTVPVGEGLHTIALTPGGRHALVTNSTSNTVTVVDTQSLSRVADIAVGRTPVGLAYGATSKLFYVASVNDEAVSVIDPAKRQVVARVPVRRGVVALRFEPAGRFGFAVNQVESKVTVIDSATNSAVGEVEVAKGPDQVTFTNRYAYVRATGSEKFSLVELSGVEKGKLAAVDVTAGREPASALPAELGVADMIQPTPEGNAAVIANAPDAMLYYYVEGMMAPMGTLSNYKRRPRALMVLDRSLSETAPGVYSAAVRLAGPGSFDVPLIIDQPRLVNCFQLEVAPSPDGKGEVPRVALKVQPTFEGRQFRAGEQVKLGFKLTDPATGAPVEGLKDLQVLVFEPPGVWQQRQWATEVRKGEYEVTQVFPREGLYNVMVRAQSRGVNFADLPSTRVTVTASAGGAPKGAND